MKPRSVRSEEDLVSISTLNRLHDVIKPSDTGGISINVRMSDKLIYDLLMRSPVISETSQMGNDKIYIRVLRRYQLDDVSLTNDIHQHRQAKRARCFTDFSRRHRIMAVHFDSAKTPQPGGLFNHRVDAPGVTLTVNKGKADQSIGMTLNELRQLRICFCVVAVKGPHHHGSLNTRSLSTPQIQIKWRVGIPGRGQQVPLTSMTMTINDHGSSFLH